MFFQLNDFVTCFFLFHSNVTNATKFDLAVKYDKVSQGSSFFKSFVELKSSMLHAKFQDDWNSCFGKKNDFIVVHHIHV